MCNELEIMIPDIEGWAIVKYVGGNSGAVEVYAEHINGCVEEWNEDAATWCWQAEDAMLGYDNLCWQCKNRVPDSIVGLVAMAEWR